VPESRRAAIRCFLGGIALLAAISLLLPASAKAVRFVLLSGPKVGTTIKTSGGPAVPDRLNRGPTRGRLVPQSGGNQFTFKGRLAGAGAARRGEAVSEEAAPLSGVPDAIAQLSYAIDNQERALELDRSLTYRIQELKSSAGTHLDFCMQAVRNGIAPGESRDRILNALTEASQKDLEAIGHYRDAQEARQGSDRYAQSIRRARVAIREALGLKRDAMRILAVSDLIVAEPDPAAGFSLFDLGEGSANDIDDAGNVIGEDTSVTPAQGFVREVDGDHVLLNPFTPGLPTNVTGIGPGGFFGGVEGSTADPSCVTWSSVYAPRLLREGCRIADGSEVGFVGDLRLPSGRHVAIWFKLAGQGRGSAPRGGAFRRITVGDYAGSSALFTANDRGLAFGDHFLRGSSGPFRAFRADLNKRGQPTTELYRPPGGSTQPLAATNAGLAGGGALLANGNLVATFWWGDKHYSRFVGRGGAVVRGLNEAGVAVGTIDANGDPHAALFLGGVAYDLNDLNLTGAAGWELTGATDINDRGQIVGNGIVGGVQHAFLLNPSP
jgi:hypothetical protein